MSCVCFLQNKKLFVLLLVAHLCGFEDNIKFIKITKKKKSHYKCYFVYLGVARILFSSIDSQAVN